MTRRNGGREGGSEGGALGKFDDGKKQTRQKTMRKREKEKEEVQEEYSPPCLNEEESRQKRIKEESVKTKQSRSFIFSAHYSSSFCAVLISLVSVASTTCPHLPVRPQAAYPQLLPNKYYRPRQCTARNRVCKGTDSESSHLAVVQSSHFE